MIGCNERLAQTTCVPALPGWATSETGKPVHLIANTVTLSGRDIRWNGVSIDEQKLVSHARQSSALNPVPFLIFDPGNAPDCQYATRVRDILDREYPCRDGACWLGSEAELKQAPFKPYTGNAIP
jgi:hypothetical protein